MVGWVPVVLHVKARKTATTGAKTTTTAVVASAAIEPQSHLLFVLIILKIINFLSITVPSSPSSVFFFSSRIVLN